MRLSSKCLAVALAALFAVTPAVPAGAMPLPVVTAHPVEAGTGVQLVDHRYYRRHMRTTRSWGNSDGDTGYYGRRVYRDGWNDGRRGYRYHRRHRHSDAWVPLAILGMGAVIGGAIANDRAYSGGGSQVNWCANRYRSYRAYDNTYQPYGGPRRQCYSPYR